MFSINPKKCFIIPETKLTLEQIENEIPENWAEKLQTIFSNSKLFIGRKSLSDHIGQQSTYHSKVALSNMFKELYAHLPKESDSEYASQMLIILEKISEGIDGCSEGLQERVYEILRGFYIPANITDLLYQIRYDIVSTTAIKHYNEVHTKNRFFLLAGQAGYGVEAFNKDDTYMGHVSDNKINSLVSAAFDKEYTPLQILNKLCDEIKGLMHDQYEYMGENTDPNGYEAGQYEHFMKCIKQILPNMKLESDYELLKTNEDAIVVDLNWNKIKVSLFEELQSNSYFLEIPEALSQYVSSLNDEHVDTEAFAKIDLTSLISNPSDLIPLLKFMEDGNELIKDKLARHYVANINVNDKISDLLQFKKATKLSQTLSLEIDNLIAEYDKEKLSNPKEWFHGYSSSTELLNRYKDVFNILDDKQMASLLNNPDAKAALRSGSNNGHNDRLLAYFLERMVSFSLEDRASLASEIEGLITRVVNYCYSYYPRDQHNALIKFISTLPAEFLIKALRDPLVEIFPRPKGIRPYRLPTQCELIHHLVALSKKMDHFKQLPNAETDPNSAYNVAETLYKHLIEHYNTYVNSEKNQLDRQTLKSECIKAVKIAEPELSKHRGAKDILCMILLSLTGIGAVYLAIKFFNQGSNYKLTNTNTMNSINEMVTTIETIGAWNP